MVQNFALAAIVALFATATLAAPTNETTAGHNPSEKDVKASTETHDAADATKKEEPKKEEEKK
jgi:hypothetical protein